MNPPASDPIPTARALSPVLVVFAAFGLVFALGPPGLREVVFERRWPFWVGGPAIGAFVVLMLVGADRMLGVSTGFGDACAAPFDPEARASWRLPFLFGIVFGGAAAALLAGGLTPTLAMGMFDTAVTDSLVGKAVVFTTGGVLIGFGTRFCGGCTSGHGIFGTAQMAPASWLATASFMGAGFVVTNLVIRVVGGGV